MTLEEYLRKNIERQAIDHVIRARIAPSGRIICYIHAQGFDSDTLDFYVDGDVVNMIQGNRIPE